MKNKILLIFFIIPFSPGCEEKPNPREFPIIWTLNPINIDVTGATFRGELVYQGITPITSFGFVWSDHEPNITESNKIIVGTILNQGVFEARIDSAIVKGVEYKIRAFATYSNKTIYGNIISFTSKGCNKSSWSLELTNIGLNGFAQPYGNASNQYGYIIFQSSETYIYNPGTNELKASVNFPIIGNTYTQFTSVFFDNIQFFFSNISKDLIRLDNGVWYVQSRTPFDYWRFLGFYLGFAYSDQIYLLSSSISYSYNLNTNEWQTKAILPTSTGYSVGGTLLDNKAYILTSGKSIWEYDINSDTWKIKTTYPGNIKDFVVSFAYDGKIYLGLCYPNYNQVFKSDWMESRLWSYDPVLNKWSNIEGFPVKLSSGRLFSFFIKDKLYIGHAPYKEPFNIWMFDPSK